MAFLASLKAQVNNINLSIGDLTRDVPYPISSMKNVNTKYGTAVSCILRDPAGTGTITVYLPKTVQIGDGDIAAYNIGNLPSVSLIFRGLNNRSFIIDFE